MLNVVRLIPNIRDSDPTGGSKQPALPLLRIFEVYGLGKYVVFAKFEKIDSYSQK